MKLSMKNFPIMIILIASGIYACANETIPKRSGFLSDYSKLSKTPYKDAEGAYSYVNPQKPLNLYSNFIVLPVQIRLVQGAIATKVPQEDMQKLADFFYHKLIMELKNSDYHVVQEPGPNTLILRVAITNLEPTNPIVSWSRNPSPKFGGI